jgi:hypothetical protein
MVVEHSRNHFVGTYTQSKVAFSKALNLRLQKVPLSFGEGIGVRCKKIEA